MTEHMLDTTDATFQADVWERSKLGLVLVDFWAEWCAPCRTLGPILEQLAVEYAGKLTLVKADTEANGQAAAQFGVSGIPAVFAVLDGEILDTFQGALPEPAIRDWIDALLGKALLVEARQIVSDDPTAAENLFRDILKASPHEYEAAIGLAGLLVDSGREDECRSILDKLAERGFLEPEAERIRARLELKGKSQIDIDAARADASAHPEDFEKQLQLAEALVGCQEYQEAFEICLSLVERDRHETGEKAKELMVDVFRVLPDGSELTSDYRRRLSMLLY